MDVNPADFNPTDKLFDFEFGKVNVHPFTNLLRKENCYNPLIAYHGRRVLLDYYDRLDHDDLPIAFHPKTKPYTREEISSYLLTLRCGVEPAKLSPDYYNARNRFRFNENEACALNTAWYVGLKLVREYIEAKSLHGVIAMLSSLSNSFADVGLPFPDFMKFSGIFYNSKWLTKAQPNRKQAGYNDILYSWPLPNDKIPHGWKIYALDVAQFRDHLCNCYIALGKPIEGTPGLKRFQTTFDDFIYGLNFKEDTFETLLSGLQDSNRLFDKKINKQDISHNEWNKEIRRFRVFHG